VHRGELAIERGFVVSGGEEQVALDALEAARDGLGEDGVLDEVDRGGVALRGETRALGPQTSRPLSGSSC